MVGAAGTAIMLVCFFVAQVIIGVIVAAYASRCFLLVVEDTAAGNDEVVWPDEPFLDWFGKVFYLGSIVAVWLLPAIVIGRLAASLFPGENPAVVTAAVVAGFFWLVFPVTILSTLSSTSRWSPFRPAVVRLMARAFGSTLAFYFVSGLLLAGCTALVVVGLATWVLLPVGAVAVGTTLLVYARLLGRLAWKLNQLVPAATAKPEPEQRPRPARRKPRVKARPSEGGWGALPEPDVPDLDKPSPIVSPFDERIDEYGMAEKAPPPRQKIQPIIGLDRIGGPRRAAPEGPDGNDPASKEAAGQRQRKPIVLPTEGPIEEYETKREKPPARKGSSSFIGPDGAGDVASVRAAAAAEAAREPPTQGIWSFPFYAASRKAWLILSGSALLMGVLFRFMIQFWPA
jgi:hypothetical protein